MTQASSGGGGGQIPSALGWYQIPNTAMSSICPNYPEIQANQGCAGINRQWGSALADTSRNRMVIWGGGHNGYYGNEVYSINLNNNPINITLLKDASHGSAIANLSSCPDAYSDGNPTPRHTGGGMVYLPAQDAYHTHGWGLPPCGNFGNGMWWFNPNSATWTAKNPSGGPRPDQEGSVATEAFDSVTGNIYRVEANAGALWQYNPAANSWTDLKNLAVCSGTDLEGAIDPGRRLYFCLGSGNFQSYSLNSPYTLKNLTGTNCGGIASQSPVGFEYDTVQKLMIIWSGGNTVFQYNPDTDSCISVTYPGGPPAQLASGTYGRFRYFPALGVFIVVNDYNQNAYSLRLTQGSGGGSTGPNISGITVTSIATTGATVSWTTDVPATTQVEYGTTTAYGSSTTLNASLVTSHSQALTGLAVSTLYHYRVHSKNSGGTESISGDAAFTTSSGSDTTPPTVSITAPSSGATVSGTVSVTANASDNVGVTSVQFQLDGANLGAALTASPYSTSWDTTTASNGTHALTAQARDAAGNVGNATAVSVTVSNSTSTALQDFQNRCAQAGVIVCQGFDDASVFAPATYPASGVYPDGGNSFSHISQDTTVSASGGGSLKFTVPSMAGANNAGYWRQLFAPSLTAGPSSATVFGQNSTFYIQYRQRFSPEYLTNQWPQTGGGTTFWKQQIISSDQSTCGNIELTTVNGNMKGFPQMYSQCGADSLIVALANGDYLLEQGDTSTTGYNCHYQQANNTSTSCFDYPSNTWVTFFYKIQIGTWGQANSTIQAWVSVGGQPYQEWINMPNHILNQDAGLPAYDTVTLLTYMTGRDSSVSAGPTAFTWFDELIVSSNPIAAPNN